MIIAAALAGVIVLMATGLAWAAHLVHIGALDMQAPSVAPVRQQGPELEFRRRRSLERVHAVLVAEQLVAAPHG